MDVLSARGSIVRTIVAVDTRSRGDEVVGRNNDVHVDRLAAHVRCATRRATVDGHLVVLMTHIAALAVEVINNTVTAHGHLAITTAGVGTIHVSGAIIALLSRVNDAITAHGVSASRAAATILTVLLTIIAGLSRVDAAVAAQQHATICASGGAIALLVIVDKTVTAVWEAAVSAAIASNVVTIIALLEARGTGIGNIITAVGQLAV